MQVLFWIHIQNKSMLLKASFSSTIQQGKDDLFNKLGAATTGYSVGKKLDPLLLTSQAIYKNIPDGPKI